MTERQDRFNIDDLFAAIEATATELSVMSGQIAAQEAINFRLQEGNSELRAQLAEALKIAEETKAAAAVAARSADQAEAKVAGHLDCVRQLENDLATAINDIIKISAAVSGLRARTRQHL